MRNICISVRHCHTKIDEDEIALQHVKRVFEDAVDNRTPLSLNFSFAGYTVHNEEYRKVINCSGFLSLGRHSRLNGHSAR